MRIHTLILIKDEFKLKTGLPGIRLRMHRTPNPSLNATKFGNTNMLDRVSFVVSKNINALANPRHLKLDEKINVVPLYGI
jgi:hypothetical protein